MATKKEGTALLKGIPMFSELSQRELGVLWASFKIVSNEAGMKIMAEGRGGVGLHMILKGQAKVSRPGKKIILGPGQFFGELSLIDDGPRSASVSAETDLESAVILKWSFERVVKQNPSMGWKLIEHLAARLREEQSALDRLRS